jgi:hypothetical protein
VAWRFVTHLSRQDAIDHLCCDLPQANQGQDGRAAPNHNAGEHASLLDGYAEDLDDHSDPEDVPSTEPDQSTSYGSNYEGMTALEIAAVADAKKFLSQRAVQRIIDGIWMGDIVFWDAISQHSTKQARIYNPHKSDPFCRLRVPLYLKAFEVLFFAAFLAFYYVVLVQKSNESVTFVEVLLYFWLAAFAHNGIGLEDVVISVYGADTTTRARRILGCRFDPLRHRLLVLLG